MAQATQTERQPSGLSVDEAAHTIRNSRRRAVIELLWKHGSMAKRELAERIAADEFGRTINSPDGTDKRQAVYVGLHQSHLPHLVEIRAVRDLGQDTYSLGPEGPDLFYAIDELTERFEEESA